LSQGEQELRLRVWLQDTATGRRLEVDALIDCGASGIFADKHFVNEHKLTTHLLDAPVTVRNADGTENQGGPIVQYIDILMEAPAHMERIKFEILRLDGSCPIILGLPWLRAHNPIIDWGLGTVVFDKCPTSHHRMQDGGAHTFGMRIALPPGFQLGQEAMTSIGWLGSSTDRAIESLIIRVSQGDSGQSTTAEEDMRAFVPRPYWGYASVFTRSIFDSLPPHSDFDHTINLQDSFVPQRGKIYSLSPFEQKEL